MPTANVGIFCNVARLRATDSIKIKICKRKAHVKEKHIRIVIFITNAVQKTCF